MPLSQEERTLSISTPLGDEVLLLRSMTAQEQLSTLFEYALELLSEDININHEDLLGQPVTVRLRLPDDQERYFNGIVNSFSHTGFDGATAIYQARMVPWTWFLTRTADCRIFQEKTVPDIIKEIFREQGYTNFEERLSGSYRQWIYCVQYRETDFNFISRLMEQEGIYYYFTHENGKHTLVLADSYSAHSTVAGYEEVPYYPPDETAMRERDHISDWSVVQAVRPGAFAHTDYDFAAPKKNLLTKRSSPKAHELADLEIFDYPGEYVESGDGENYARIRLEEMHTDYENVRASGNARGLATGALFNLTNYRREDQNREYLIVAASYQLQSDVFGSGGASAEGPIFQCTLTAIHAQTPFRPSRTTPKPMVQGPQTAVVVGKTGEEIWTDEYGRVKVQFHWDRYGKSNENSSCWVRVSHPWAGKGWGSVAIPRIGQEVIVDFLEGDPDQPIITGRVYNKDCMPPYGLPGGAVVSGIKSDTHKGGGYNEISMDDTAGKEKVTTHAQYDMDTTVEHDQTLTVHNCRRSTIDVDDTETVSGNQTQTVKGNREETVDGSETITINSTRTEHVKGAEGVTIDAATKHTINANYDRKVTGNNTLDTDGNIKNTAGSNWQTEAGAKASLKADKITINGTSKVEIVSGDSKITLEPGKITISTGGIIEEGAGGDFKMKGAKISLN